ncbi:conjugal transfer mating pair stabilization protein TraG (plasmid) [Edwardsiella hoshinae]|uniref:Conjugal transfer mating pair stabilization protein TraG n=1 Tax=Edwardsiella hoshinae TaxID=93378 RepID=A0A376IYR2_9GAMM|nr:conjugal transfer mating-pair stabilization protein TraG [Edwardsiella hoshinae]QPR26587.1 conjugal transfer mating pair stabilization protein TraG [Edwardsiella hoshinae]STE53255.1 conjugal transfer mating pair stabilization protein TraG [Edwardsiella hoshinae]
MLEIYTIAGGEWLRGTFNAIAAFMGTDTWKTLERMAILFSALAVALIWIRRHNVMDMLGWAVSITVIGMMVGMRSPIQIIDSSDMARVYQVDNVPVGLALPASLTTRIGHALVQGYETVFSQPDSVTYSKTGMLFGANLVAHSTDFLSRNPELINLFTDYVQNCVMGDIFLNHKYTFEDLMNSSDPYTLIFSRPSPLRGVFDKNNNFRTCQEAAVDLKRMLALDTQNGGKTWRYYVRQLFGGRPNPDLLFSQLIGDSYNYFYGSSKNASQILRQNVTLNALRGGVLSYAARNGDTSSLINIATTSSLEKQRLAHASVGQVALRSLPMMQVIIMGILIGLFPIMMVAGMFNMVTLTVLKGYLFAFMWLQTWPLLYAILNSAMTYYAKQNGVPVVLSELSRVQVKYSDIATTAGYISMMIPFLSWKMVMGLGQVFSSISSSLGSASLSSTTAASSSAVDGNYTFANMQTDNVNGYSWNTNSTTSFGQLTSQTGSGGTATQTRDGNMVYDSSGAMSKLPVDINVTRQIASAQQQMARESAVQAESALQGYTNSVSSAWNSLKQFGSNMGSSSSYVSGADNSQNTQESMMRGQMWNAVQSYAKANHISNEQAFNTLMDKSSRLNKTLEGYAGGKWDSGDMLPSKFGKWATGMSAYAGGRGSVGNTWSDGETDSITDGHRQTNDMRHDSNAQAARDFKESLDYLSSHRTSQSGSHTENNATSRVDQLSASLSSAKNSYDQYTASNTRSHEYAEMASRTESMSGQMSENLTQQFVNFVQQRAPENAEAILTNTASPDVAAQREELAREFVREQVAPRVDGEYAHGRQQVGKGMGAVSAGGNQADVMADYQANSATIERQTQQAELPNNVRSKVEHMVDENQNRQHSAKNEINNQTGEVKGEYSHLGQEYKQQQDKYHVGYQSAKAKMDLMPGADTKEELLEKAKKLQDENERGQRK